MEPIFGRQVFLFVFFVKKFHSVTPFITLSKLVNYYCRVVCLMVKLQWISNFRQVFGCSERRGLIKSLLKSKKKEKRCFSNYLKKIVILAWKNIESFPLPFPFLHFLLSKGMKWSVVNDEKRLLVFLKWAAKKVQQNNSISVDIFFIFWNWISDSWYLYFFLF